MQATGSEVAAVDGETSIRGRMIQDSLRHWVTQMHVNGFRFDLASILSRGSVSTKLGTPGPACSTSVFPMQLAPVAPASGFPSPTTASCENARIECHDAPPRPTMTADASESKNRPGRSGPVFLEKVAAAQPQRADAPSAANLQGVGHVTYGTAVTFNLNRSMGIEGEFGSMIATTSDLQFGDLSSDPRYAHRVSAGVIINTGR